MSSVHLLGGGWDAAATPALYGPFLEAAGPSPVVATVVLDEGDGAAQAERWARVLHATAPCTPVPVLVPLGGTLDVGSLGGAGAVLVCGGLTPAYAAALAPAAAALRAWVDAGHPYAGFSAGAAVAPERALVGGWRDGGVAVCPDGAAEDLEEVTVVAGVGLVPWTVDVHAAQWGTLPRLLAAVASQRLPAGLALDEGTAVHVQGGRARVAGTGAAWLVRPAGDGAVVTALRAGALLPQP